MISSLRWCNQMRVKLVTIGRRRRSRSGSLSAAGKVHPMLLEPVVLGLQVAARMAGVIAHRRQIGAQLSQLCQFAAQTMVFALELHRTLCKESCCHLTAICWRCDAGDHAADLGHFG